jgi:hypothetical protein
MDQEKLVYGSCLRQMSGWVTVGLGMVGLGRAAVVLVDPESLLAAVGILALIAFHLVLGWKVYGLSRASG